MTEHAQDELRLGPEASITLMKKKGDKRIFMILYGKPTCAWAHLTYPQINQLVNALKRMEAVYEDDAQDGEAGHRSGANHDGDAFES